MASFSSGQQNTSRRRCRFRWLCVWRISGARRLTMVNNLTAISCFHDVIVETPYLDDCIMPSKRKPSKHPTILLPDSSDMAHCTTIFKGSRRSINRAIAQQHGHSNKHILGPRRNQLPTLGHACRPEGMRQQLRRKKRFCQMPTQAQLWGPNRHLPS